MRPGYRPLPRPYDSKRKGAMPMPPPALAGVVAFPPMARAVQRLGITLAEADERLTVEDVLDEADLTAYLHDVDHEPETEPRR